MIAPNDPNAPPPEFALSPSPAPPAKPPAPRTAEAAAKGVKVVARAGRDGPERETREAGAAKPDAPGGFGALVQRLLGREPTGPELAEFVRVRTPWACATTTRCGWCCWRCNTSGGNSNSPSTASDGNSSTPSTGGWRKPDRPPMP